MNIEMAKAIPIAEILEKIELKPVKETATDATYSSPLRNERTPSFHVNKEKNVWYDHGEGIGGNAFELVVQILKASGHSYRAQDALRWFRNTNLDPGLLKPRDPVKDKTSKWKLIREAELQNRGLCHYLEQRGIGIEIAKKFVREIYAVKHQPKISRIYGIGFKNEDDGFEFRNRFFKSCISPKTISFIRADAPKPDRIMVFEGFMDFLTYATITKGKLAHDTIVLNSVACVDHAIRYIKNYGYQVAHTWMDNDKAGEKAKQRLDDFIKTEEGLVHKPLNHLYHGHKDLNEWHMFNLGLTPIN